MIPKALAADGTDRLAHGVLAEVKGCQVLQVAALPYNKARRFSLITMVLRSLT